MSITNYKNTLPPRVPTKPLEEPKPSKFLSKKASTVSILKSRLSKSLTSLLPTNSVKYKDNQSFHDEVTSLKAPSGTNEIRSKSHVNVNRTTFSSRLPIDNLTKSLSNLNERDYSKSTANRQKSVVFEDSPSYFRSQTLPRSGNLVESTWRL